MAGTDPQRSWLPAKNAIYLVYRFGQRTTDCPEPREYRTNAPYRYSIQMDSRSREKRILQATARFYGGDDGRWAYKGPGEGKICTICQNDTGRPLPVVTW